MIKVMTSKRAAPANAAVSVVDTASLSQQPEQAPTISSNDHKGTHKTIIYLLVALAVVTATAVGYWLYWQAHELAPTASNNQVTRTAPSTAAGTLGDLSVRYVTLPLTADQAATDPINGPAQMVATAGGHYLLRDLRGSSYAHHNTGGKLIYDGQTIYDGPYLWTFALSQNGEHYLYTLDTSVSLSGGSIQMYLDGKLVQSFADNKGLFYPQVSNDGKHYAYVTGALSTDIVKDGKVIYTNSYVETIFNADLTKYIAATQRNTDHYNVVVDGTQVASNVPFLEANALTAISNNGQHYIYRSGNSLYKDGKKVATGKSIDAAAVTDIGAYALADLGSNNLNINGKSNPIPASLAQGCTPSCFYSPPLQLAISPSGDHYIIGTQQLPFWDVDGQQVSAQGNIQSVEFVGTSLYLYRWTQPSDAYAGWKTYISKLGGVSIKYPADWTASAQPYTSTLDDGSQEEMMSWQSPYAELDGQQRAISMTLQALTGYQRCDANLPIFKTQNVTVDGHPLTIVTTGNSSQIEYVYLTDATGLSDGGTLPTCSAAADIKSPSPQTKTLQLTVQFVAPCSPGSHCGYVNTPLTAQQYSDYPLVSQAVKSFESLAFNQ